MSNIKIFEDRKIRTHWNEQRRLYICVFFVSIFAICLMLCGCAGKTNSQDYNVYDLQNLTVFCADADDIVYDGTPKEVTVVIKTKTGKTIERISPDDQSKDFSIEYYNNINAGTAEVVISAKNTSNYKGSAKVTFTIKATSIGIDNVDDLFALFENPNYQMIYLTADITISENKVLNIPQDKMLDCKNYSLINKGEIINDGCLEIKRKNDITGFINDGKFVNNNKIVLYSSRIVDTGKLENNGEILSVDGYSSLYTNEQLSCDKGKIGRGVYVYIRSSIEDAIVTLEYAKKEYTGNYLCPKITVSLDSKTISADEYDVYYDNNLNRGKASVLVRAKETSSIFFGEKTIYFEIEGTTVEVNNEDDLIQKLDNPNYSNIVVSRKIINKDIVIGSDKTVCAYSGTEFNGKVTISGTLKVLTTNTMPAKLNGDIIIEESGQLCNEGKIFLKGSITGQGQALNSNEGKIIVIDNQDASLEWENKGSIFVNTGYTIKARGTGSVVTRVCLTANDILIPSNKYDGEEKFPTIDWQECEDPQKGWYSIEVYKKDTEERVLSPTNKGEYTVKVKFNEYYEKYYGEFSLDYIILPGEITVNAPQELYDVINNENYGKITLVKNVEEIEEFNYPLTIKAGCELIISENFKFSNKTTINVLGKITNNGNYAEGNIQNGLSISDQGSFVNNGNAYFNVEEPDGIIGDGVVYIRENINNSTVDYFTPAEKIQYTTYAYTPSFRLKFDDYQLIPDVDYSPRYENYREVSLEGKPAIAIAHAKAFSEKVFGQKRMEYYLLPGKIDVYSLSSLINALANVREGTDGTDVCNWKEVNLMVDIEETNNSNNTITLRVCKNTTLNLGTHKLELIRGLGVGTYVLENNGIITAATDYAISLPNQGLSGCGKTIGLIDDTFDVSKIEKMMRNYDEIRLCSDITKAENEIIRCPAGKAYTIDLCGYTLNAKIQINIEEASVIITSSGEKGTLGSTEKVPTIKLYIDKTINATTTNNSTLTLKNLDAYGIEVYKGAYEITDNNIISNVIVSDEANITT